MRSTMQDVPLTIAGLFRHGESVYAGSEVITLEEEGPRRARFAEVAARARRLATALSRLGVGAGDRVATLCWNTQEHLEAYLAVPSMGAVLHTINLRLHPEEIAYIIKHAGDRVVIVDGTLLDALLRALPDRAPLEHVIVVGAGDAPGLGPLLRYEALLADAAPLADWPDLDESEAAAMCYTSGTTGRPKGVVYSHRSTYLHSLAASSGAALGLSEHDRVLPIVPMFHANAWGLPYAAWMVGADLILPGRCAHAAGLARLFAEERPTVAAAVPTVYQNLLGWGETHPLDLRSARMLLCGGAAMPPGLMRIFDARYGVTLVQGWGMTETSPIAALAIPPKDLRGADGASYRCKTGRVLLGVELRLAGEDRILPWDGTHEGEIEVRGPWVTGSYHLDGAPEKFHDGWLRTGDVGTVDAQGFVQITDRRKDVIKSGGEWISSVALENALMSHPAVREAAVIGVPDDRWQERPLACVVPRPDGNVSVAELWRHLAGQVARWWVPERWTFIDEVPKTSVGKFDKKVLRARYAEGAFDIVIAG